MYWIILNMFREHVFQKIWYICCNDYLQKVCDSNEGDFYYFHSNFWTHIKSNTGSSNIYVTKLITESCLIYLPDFSVKKRRKTISSPVYSLWSPNLIPLIVLRLVKSKSCPAGRLLYTKRTTRIKLKSLAWRWISAI